MSDTIKGFRGKDGPILLDFSGVANVPGAIQSIGELTAAVGDHFEVAAVDSAGRVATVKAVAKPGGGSGQNPPQDGEDGFSPIATVTQTDDGATITITDVNGTTTANVTNGRDGAPGSDYVITDADTARLLAEVRATSNQQAPLFANSVDDCADTSKVYVLPDGYIYAYLKALPDVAYESHVNKQWNNVGNLMDANGIDAKNTNVIPVKEGDQFVYTGCGQYNVSIFWLKSATLSRENIVSTEIYYDGYGKPATVTVTAPVGATHVMFASWGEAGKCVLEVTALTRNFRWANTGHAFVPADYEDRIVALESIVGKTTSVLRGKKIVYDGDSICQSNVAINGGAYAKLIADKTGCVYVNQAVGGGRLTTAGGNSWHSVVDNLANLPTDGDLYCFEGGINDYWTPKNLGTFSETDFTGALDTSTVCGALEAIFRYALNNFVGKPVCFVITHKVQDTAYRANSKGDSFKDYHDAMVGICEKYAIPYYDAFAVSGLNGWNDAQNNAFLTGNSSGTPDGCHPNEEGYKRYYVPRLTKLFESIMPVT